MQTRRFVYYFQFVEVVICLVGVTGGHEVEIHSLTGVGAQVDFVIHPIVRLAERVELHACLATVGGDQHLGRTALGVLPPELQHGRTRQIYGGQCQVVGVASGVGLRVEAYAVAFIAVSIVHPAVA